MNLGILGYRLPLLIEVCNNGATAILPGAPVQWDATDIGVPLMDSSLPVELTGPVPQVAAAATDAKFAGVAYTKIPALAGTGVPGRGLISILGPVEATTSGTAVIADNGSVYIDGADLNSDAGGVRVGRALKARDSATGKQWILLNAISGQVAFGA